MFKILIIIIIKYVIQFKIVILYISLNVGILWIVNNFFYFFIKYNIFKIRVCKFEVNQNLYIFVIGVLEINCI